MQRASAAPERNHRFTALLTCHALRSSANSIWDSEPAQRSHNHRSASLCATPYHRSDLPALRAVTLTISDHSAMLCSHVLSAARQRKFNLGFRVWAAQSQPQICQSLRHTFTDQICQLCAQSHSQFQICQSFQAALQLEPNHCQLPRSLSLERGILNGR